MQYRSFLINKGYGDINQLQLDIMKVVMIYVREKKKPVPQRFLISEIIKTKGTADKTIAASIRVLIQKGYIRKAIVTDNKIRYVMLRSVNV